MLSIERCLVVDAAVIAGLNLLVDEGNEWDADQGSRFLADRNNALFLARVGGSIVGFVLAYRLQRFDRRAADIYLDEIGVDPAYQRRGIGRALMEATRRWGLEVDATQLWLVTNTSNRPAVSLYQSTGGESESDDEIVFQFVLEADES